MAYGRRFDEWDRVSLLASLLHKELEPRAFNPFLVNEKPKPQAPLKIDIHNLIAVLGGKTEIVK
jgi:hypothetical protein